jgi:single-strand DNA-binding protein
MLTLSGSGHLTRAPELRSTDSGKAVTTVSVASSRRDRDADPICVDLVLWERQAEAAVEHLVKGQAVAFSGRLEPRPWTTQDGKDRLALELRGVDLEYGAKPRGMTDDASAPAPDDIAF